MTRSNQIQRFLKIRNGQIAVTILLIYFFLALLGPWISPFPPNEIHPTDALVPPSKQYWFGTDELGRDVLSRVIAGTPVALYVAGTSVTLALIFGTIIGITCGFFRGAIDIILMRAIDVIFAFPALLLALVVVGVLGPGVENALIAIAIVYIPRFARIARASTFSVRNSLYIQVALLSGVKRFRIALRHVLPNISSPLIALAALSFSTAELAYASLSFLGLGIKPPEADWGSMLAKARGFITIAPWLVVFPAIALVLLILTFNLLGDVLRDILDPRSDIFNLPKGI